MRSLMSFKMEYVTVTSLTSYLEVAADQGLGLEMPRLSFVLYTLQSSKH